MKTPRELGLPFDDWRPGQRMAIRTILGARVPHVVINAPTGSGKSTIAAALPKLDERRHIFLTGTKALQDQYSRTFPHMFDVRGVSNYECLAARDQFKRYFPLASAKHPTMCDDGPCHSGEKCSLKEYGCLYFDRYRGALASTAPLTNYSYLIALRRFSKGLGVAQRIVCDEAHTLPEQLMSGCRLAVPKHILDRRTLPRTWRSWKSWAEAAIDRLAPGGDYDQRRRREQLVETLQGVARIDETWSWDDDGEEVVFEPTIPRLLLPYLATLDANTTIVYLSATITRGTMRTLGIEDDDLLYHEMPSYFAVERRPIYLVPCVPVTYRTMQNPATVARWLQAIDTFIDPRPRVKGLIHTVSYTRAKLVKQGSRHSKRMIVPNSRELAEAVAYFKTLPATSGAILVSPAIMTGYDFPDDDARWQIIAKVPFPDTQSRIMQARIAATDGYRDELTMQTLMQACGRIVRSENDWGETAITDDIARYFLKDYRYLAAKWFLDSIVESRRVPRPLDFD